MSQRATDSGIWNLFLRPRHDVPHPGDHGIQFERLEETASSKPKAVRGAKRMAGAMSDRVWSVVETAPSSVLRPLPSVLPGGPPCPRTFRSTAIGEE